MVWVEYCRVITTRPRRNALKPETVNSTWVDGCHYCTCLHANVCRGVSVIILGIFAAPVASRARPPALFLCPFEDARAEFPLRDVDGAHLQPPVHTVTVIFVYEWGTSSEFHANLQKFLYVTSSSQWACPLSFRTQQQPVASDWGVEHLLMRCQASIVIKRCWRQIVCDTMEIQPWSLAQTWHASLRSELG